jgi:transmembrane sensor
MNKERIKYLLEKHVSDQLTQSERDELISINTVENESAVVEVLQVIMQNSDLSPEEEQLPNKGYLDRILSLDKSNTKSRENIQRKSKRLPLTINWLAAACVTLALISVGSYFWMTSRKSRKNDQVFVTANSKTPTNYVRTINLPDGTSIILQAGSTLEVDPDFSNTNRKVTLRGEAYFDVQKINTYQNREKGSSFTIYTGKLKTVVLGTAFNIKAYPTQSTIIVSVAEGKVRIEDESKILAVLLPNQQVTYNVESLDIKQHDVDAQSMTEWTKNDLEFDGVSFENIAKFLEKRYGVTIHFKDEKLKNCMIVSSFIGTESIENVIRTLCSIQNSTYTFKSNKEIVIDGNGCE